MNKPILAAATGVTFGLFLGALFLNGYMHNNCHGTRVVEVQRVAAPRPPCQLAQPPRVVVESEPMDVSNADSTLSMAQTEFVNGNYQRAISLARTVAAESPVRAWRIIGAAACQEKDTKLADQAYRRLDAAGRQYLIYVCQRNGLTSYRGQRFKLAE